MKYTISISRATYETLRVELDADGDIEAKKMVDKIAKNSNEWKFKRHIFNYAFKPEVGDCFDILDDDF